MTKRGRPPWTPPPLEEVERLAAQGLTQAQIALCLGIAEDTLYEKKKQLAEFSEAIKRGQARGIQTVTNQLFELCREKSLGAICFYLKTRGQGNWTERQAGELTITREIGHSRILEKLLPELSQSGEEQETRADSRDY